VAVDLEMTFNRTQEEQGQVFFSHRPKGNCDFSRADEHKQTIRNSKALLHQIMISYGCRCGNPILVVWAFGFDLGYLMVWNDRGSQEVYS
jgi:hypothetical protein